MICREHTFFSSAPLEWGARDVGVVVPIFGHLPSSGFFYLSNGDGGGSLFKMNDSTSGG